MKPKSIFYKTAILLLIFPVVLTCSSCGKKNTATTMNLIKTEGTVGVDDAKGKSLKLMENMGLYSGYGVGTQTKSYAWINFDDVKLSKLDQDSKVLIEKDGGKLKVDVESGSMFFNITEALGEDESMEIRTSTMLVGIRGTSGWVGSMGDEAVIALLNGKVETTFDINGKKEAVTVHAMEELTIKEDTYEVTDLKDIPEFVKDEFSDMPVTLDDLLGVMEEVEVTDDMLTQSSETLENTLGRSAIKILAPKKSYDNFVNVPMEKEFIGLNIKTMNTYVRVHNIKQPQEEPQIFNGYSVWTEERISVIDTIHKSIIIFPENYDANNIYNEAVGVEIEFSFKIIDHENSREIEIDTIKELFDVLYNTVTEQL